MLKKGAKLRVSQRFLAQNNARRYLDKNRGMIEFNYQITNQNNDNSIEDQRMGDQMKKKRNKNYYVNLFVNNLLAYLIFLYYFLLFYASF